MYKKLPTSANVPEGEKAILAHWAEHDVFARSVELRPAEKPFVFYEGPPTANGRPGVHHVIARLTKDLICRYKTMTGHRVVRKAGWDTHGLPVEIEVENELGIKNKEEIEAYGLAEFNAKCRESVFRYEKDWRQFTERIGYWVDLDHPYITCENEYVETVWWIIAQFWKKDMLYEGHKIVPFCPRCETSLSSHEVSLGYKDVSDPSVFVKFRRRDSDEKFLVWTTTPWTLISNVALAVGPEHDYVRARHGDETLILAEALLPVLDGDYDVIDKMKGADLVGAVYEPLFDFFAGAEGAFRVLPADFVSLDDGTGIVHIAPAFGEDDYGLHREHGVPLIQAVHPNGTFTDEVTPWAGKWIKGCDPEIIKRLKAEGKLYKSEKYEHPYPFCWRCSTPLIYYARKSWYIRTTSYKEEMIAANAKINWIPKEVGEHRFGNWLENNVDWSLSRERFWGTPLNIWVCDEDSAHKHCVESIAELREMSRNFPDDPGALDLHRPMVDGLELACPQCEGAMRRVAEVIDVWFDSGAMPFAQYHYPWDESGMFASQFPADYISEGIDQSRGWFYSLLAIATFIKGESPYRNCLTTELILDKTGQKMSKSKGNTVEPWDLLDHEGADAVRWYLLTTSPPWVPTRFDRQGVVESSQKMMGTLRNVYSFFAMYANIDSYSHGDDTGTPSRLDEWILSRFHSTTVSVRASLEAFELTRAARDLQVFVLDELSNWYVRRSRRRFWKGEAGPDKTAAYHTLYTVLDGVARLLAPLVPFIAEEVYLALRPDAGGGSVHLEDYPEPDVGAIDETLEAQMETALTVASMGRSVRNDAGIRVRQPLSEVVVFDPAGPARLESFLSQDDIVALVLEELNVRDIRVAEGLADAVTFAAKPNFPLLGKRFGKRVPDVQKAIAALSQEELMGFLTRGEVEIDIGDTVALERDELSVSVEARDGFGAAFDRGLVVVVDLEISEALRLEGMAREIINRVQNLRKSAGFDVTDRIEIAYVGSEFTDKVVAAESALIRNETLAVEISNRKVEWRDSVEFEIDGEHVALFVQKTH